VLGHFDDSDKEDIQVNEEDYDATALEEMKERSEPKFYDADDIPNLSV